MIFILDVPMGRSSWDEIELDEVHGAGDDACSTHSVWCDCFIFFYD